MNIKVMFTMVLIIANLCTNSTAVDRDTSVRLQLLSSTNVLTNTSVRIGFEKRLGLAPMEVVNSLSDTNGIIDVSRKSSGRVTISVKKEEHYEHFRDLNMLNLIRQGDVRTNLTIRLKRINTPTPMFAKFEKRKFPKEDGTFGYVLG